MLTNIIDKVKNYQTTKTMIKEGNENIIENQKNEGELIRSSDSNSIRSIKELLTTQINLMKDIDLSFNDSTSSETKEEKKEALVREMEKLDTLKAILEKVSGSSGKRSGGMTILGGFGIGGFLKKSIGVLTAGIAGAFLPIKKSLNGIRSLISGIGKSIGIGSSTNKIKTVKPGKKITGPSGKSFVAGPDGKATTTEWKNRNLNKTKKILNKSPKAMSKGIKSIIKTGSKVAGKQLLKPLALLAGPAAPFILGGLLLWDLYDIASMAKDAIENDDKKNVRGYKSPQKPKNNLNKQFKDDLDKFKSSNEMKMFKGSIDKLEKMNNENMPKIEKIITSSNTKFTNWSKPYDPVYGNDPADNKRQNNTIINNTTVGQNRTTMIPVKAATTNNKQLALMSTL